MFIRKLDRCKEITAGDNTILRELFNPLKDDLYLRYSLAHAVVRPGDITYPHKLTGSEVYYILEGEGEMYIDDQTEKVFSGQAVYIPPNSVQKIKNIGLNDLKFLCLVDPPWKAEDEEIL
ncbi:MAG: cupin domain-containing protein [candidate division Zixibacteria bacterium]|nr:cupin domain-containing protein [candidate division Zixibacteria bacterium]